MLVHNIGRVKQMPDRQRHRTPPSGSARMRRRAVDDGRLDRTLLLVDRAT
jgi:hypothetical protein